MSAEDFDDVKIMDQKPENVIIRPNQRKTKMAKLNFGEVILCCANYCQMLSVSSFEGVERRSLRQIYCKNTYFSPVLPREVPKWHFSVKLGKMPFWGLPWAKMVRNICFPDKYTLSDLWVENRQLINSEVA